MRAGRSDACGLERIGFDRVALAMGGEHHVARVREKEQDPGKQRGPEQVPRDVRQDPLTPWVATPRQEVHDPSTPRMARFTRFRISGIL